MSYGEEYYSCLETTTIEEKAATSYCRAPGAVIKVGDI